MAEENKKVKESEKTEGEAGEGAEGEGVSKGSAKKKLIIIIAVSLLVLIGGGAGAFFMLKGKKSEEAKTEEASGEHGKAESHGKEDDKSAKGPIYMDLGEFLVNLNTGGKQVHFLKMVVTIEIGSADDQSAIRSFEPRIRDSFQVYLRELRSEDLEGSAGLQRLREELLLRLNKIVAPTKVNDILFKDIIVQ